MTLADPADLRDARQAPALAILPAAGEARRLAGVLGGSKEVAPVVGAAGEPAQPAVLHVLSALATAGVAEATIVLRRGKWDVAEAVGRGPVGGPPVRFVVTDPTPSVPHSLALALPPAGHGPVVLAFPDILLRPREAYARVLAAYRAGRSDLVLGLFPTRQPEKTDMVELAVDGSVRALVIKQPDRGLRWTWSLAVWGPRFGALLAARVAASPEGRRGDRELYVGDVVEEAIASGLSVAAERFPDGSYLDIGTPDDLRRAQRGESPP
jgi:glucose-1-phosphate thymidylyltransferase